jgi:hypothetical protein
MNECRTPQNTATGHPGQPLLDRYRMNTAAGLSRDEAMTLALAGRVRVKARTA